MLHDLDFVCKRGQTTAIIGETGSGKSTIASLILRFHDVRGGAVRLNGTYIREMTRQGLRSHLAYVQQKAWLFSLLGKQRVRLILVMICVFFYTLFNI